MHRILSYIKCISYVYTLKKFPSLPKALLTQWFFPHPHKHRTFQKVSVLCIWPGVSGGDKTSAVSGPGHCVLYISPYGFKVSWYPGTTYTNISCRQLFWNKSQGQHWYGHLIFFCAQAACSESFMVEGFFPFLLPYVVCLILVICHRAWSFSLW